MKKLRLDMDELEVESFDAVDERRDAAGTVRAHSGEGTETYFEPWCETAFCSGGCFTEFCPSQYPTCQANGLLTCGRCNPYEI